MKKNEEEQKLLASGELWESFKKTLYFEEMEKFILSRVKEYRDMVIDASMSGKHDEARDLGQRLAGFLEISNWVDDTISTRVESLEFEREQKDFERQLPHRL